MSLSGSFRAVIPIMVLAGCAEAPVRNTLNYEISIVMETPDGAVSSSGVVETWGEPGSTYLKGEAIPIDLKDGRTVYMLMTKKPDSWEFNAPWVRIRDKDRMRSGGITLPMNPAVIPHLVMFRRLDQPSSIVEVEPNDPSKALGEGYRLVSITVSRTNRPFTSGILKRLPWLTHWDTTAEGGHHIGRDFLTKINWLSFKRDM